jgi:hypothetical protein
MNATSMVPWSLAAAGVLAVLVLGVVYVAGVRVGPLRSSHDTCLTQARAARKTVAGLAVFHEFPAGTAASPKGITLEEPCGPGDNPDIGGATLDLVGTPTSGAGKSLQAYYEALFAQDGWKTLPGAVSVDQSCYTHSKEIAGTVFYADAYADTTRAGSPFMVDVQYSLGNAEDFGCG